ncbi:hypothetical protein EO98_17390 [Methanosarcina sp. 2.H.T.1A.6]|uniref:hypothetical protein n=1 Tax=unclassified Methanosarcina TaxID=2644672 RepID=UPI0006220509|nr:MULTISPECIES: hypothetical protein [unclassified Methanosarcina]KKG14683.1 hypothetical protein EO94_01860 [Methanosarcina sp. 2.H.T.1A.3]KKG16314.1 hypothetical protein EO97_17170 [Methanosarcina sp. 2.H.T.1A.15]KKG22189.1 hypothetical protein EO96_07930 [Methanosarcina sp. 2.H.T.1A.8]KKG24529.1 hypothetical protein EO98_17390 [Methanosarcina sp. 2.H.T.1A.6]
MQVTGFYPKQQHLQNNGTGLLAEMIMIILDVLNRLRTAGIVAGTTDYMVKVRMASLMPG